MQFNNRLGLSRNVGIWVARLSIFTIVFSCIAFSNPLIETGVLALAQDAADAATIPKNHC